MSRVGLKPGAELDLPPASLSLVAALPAFQPAFLSGLGGAVKWLRDGPGFNLSETVTFVSSPKTLV